MITEPATRILVPECDGSFGSLGHKPRSTCYYADVPRRYSDVFGEPAHRSFFRDRLAAKARAVEAPADPVHEYLIDQANLRSYLGAFSDRTDLGELDPELGIEEIIVGLLQPQAPAEPRIIKLVVRALQSGNVDIPRLLVLARRERAIRALAWIVEIVPEVERTPPIAELLARLTADPPRARRQPKIHYDARRLIRKKAGARRL